VGFVSTGYDSGTLQNMRLGTKREGLVSSSAGKINRRAIVSFALSLASPLLASLFFLGVGLFGLIALPLAVLLALAGAVVGHSALRRIKKTGQSGRGIALAGVILGWVFILPLVYAAAIPLSFLLTPGW
jgi:Domain of unknown function (DUF4190)